MWSWRSSSSAVRIASLRRAPASSISWKRASSTHTEMHGIGPAIRAELEDLKAGLRPLVAGIDEQDGRG